MELLQRETRRVDALEFQKPPTEIDSPFNHEIHHFFHSQIYNITQTQTFMSPRTRSDLEVLRRCQGHGQLRSRRLVATRAEHDRSIHAERQALSLVGGWC